MYKKLTEEQFEKVLNVNNEAIIYNSKKYVNFIEAILNEDYFSKSIDTEYLEDYIEIFEVCNEIEKFKDVMEYLNKDMNVAFNFYGLDILHLYKTLPVNLFNYEGYDSSINYFNLTALFLLSVYPDSKIELDNNVVFDFTEHEEIGYGIENIAFSEMPDLKNIFENLFIKDYKIDGLLVLDYFNLLCNDKKEFFKKINLAKKINNY